MRQVLQFVNRCKAARSLRLDRPRSFGESEDDLTLSYKKSNPSIRTLNASHTHFIDHLVLPELREVICTDPDDEAENGYLDVNSCMSLLERSKCALHLTTLRLCMNAGPGEQDTITTLLQATPNLTTLDLELVFVDWRDEIDDYCYNNVADRSIMILLARMHPTQRMSGEGDILFDTILKGVAGSRLAAASLYNERKTWGTDGQLYTVFYNTI